MDAEFEQELLDHGFRKVVSRCEICLKEETSFQIGVWPNSLCQKCSTKKRERAFLEQKVEEVVKQFEVNAYRPERGPLEDCNRREARLTPSGT
jgi:hypothetical protein